MTTFEAARGWPVVGHAAAVRLVQQGGRRGPMHTETLARIYGLPMAAPVGPVPA